MNLAKIQNEATAAKTKAKRIARQYIARSKHKCAGTIDEMAGKMSEGIIRRAVQDERRAWTDALSQLSNVPRDTPEAPAQKRKKK